MKEYIFLFIIFWLCSCGIDKQTEIPILNNSIEKYDCDICNENLWTKTWVIIWRDNQADFKKEIDNIDKLIQENGQITFEHIINKARNLEYVWNLWGAIKLYEENFYKEENKNSIVYNHNMAKLYETAWEYDLALERYKYIIIEHKRNDYLRDLSLLYEMIWNEKKAKTAMDAYKKLFNNSNWSHLDIDIWVK